MTFMSSKACVSGAAAVFAALASPASAQVQYPSDEICVQSILALHRYDPGPIDGILGQRSRDTAAAFAADWRLEDLPPLSGATADQWCAALGAAQRGAGQPLDPDLTDGPDTLHCVADPVDGYARIITGEVDGDPVTLRVDARFGGAVGSLTWRGREFLNIYDHGRQISYAWHLDGHGECLNPTEPGSASDLFAQGSTSVVHEICGLAPNRLSTRINPAYWTAPGETGFCDGGTTEAVNTTLVSENLFEKVIEIGHGGIENVFLFEATITLERAYQSLSSELPTAYLAHDFTARYTFDPRTGALDAPPSLTLTEPWSYVHSAGLPVILATRDGAYALGAYTAHQGATYQMLHYDVPNPFDATNKWNIILAERPAPAGAHTYRTFAVIGTLAQVQAGMTALAALYPVDLHPGEGYVDRADCERIEGWAWDPDAPDGAMMVDVVDLATGDVVLSVMAGAFRADLPDALGDNGAHAYGFGTDEILPDGGSGEFSLRVRSSDPSQEGTALRPARIVLSCS